MIDAARVEEIRAALTCAYQVPEWGEINDMAHELFKFIDTLRADIGVAESDLFEKRERSKLRAENERLRAENQRLGYEIQTLKLEREELPSWEGLLLEYRHRQGLA